MSILNTLNTCDLNRTKTSNPIVNRRNIIIDGLSNQINSLENPDVVVKRPWYRTDNEGLKGSIRFMNKPFDFGSGKTYFLVKDENELIRVYREVIQEIKDEKLDEVISNHVSTIKSRK